MNKHDNQSASNDIQPRKPKKTGVIYTCLLRIIRAKRLRIVSLLGLFLTATIATTALPVFSQNAAAQTASGVYVDSNIHDDVVAGAFRTALASCVLERALAPDDPDATGTIDAWHPESVANGQWFGVDKLVAVTALVDSSDEQRECRTGDFVPKAIESFGWDSRTEAACDMGLIERLDGSNCVTGTGNFSLAPRVTRGELYEVIDNKRFNGNFSWTGPMLYVLYSRSVEIGCRANPQLLFDDANADQKSRANSSATYWAMDVVGRDGIVRSTIYQSSDDHRRDSEITTTVSPNALVNQRYTCIELVELANQYADEYAAYVKANLPAEDDPGEGGSTGGNETTCAVEGVGWIVCPVMTFMATVVDYSYGVVANFLETQPVSTNTSEPLFQAWSAMRNIANVAFVIVFLLIIYSQITSVGISNYNIKRMLPRLIIAAILVNISYWLCAIAVDISNILGTSIKDVFDSVGDDLYTTGRGLEDAGPGDGQWVTLVLGFLGVSAIVYAGLSVMLPFLVGAIISVLTALIILALRQALITILIIISPLAFVAFLLPNTQSMFDKWRKLFQTLLLMFPLIAVIFGGSQLAGLVIDQNADENDFFLRALALVVTVVPLFITVFITKMLNMVGGVVGRLAGVVNDPTKGVFDRMRNSAQGVRERQEMRRGRRALSGGTVVGGGRFRRRAKRDAMKAGVESEYKRAQSAYTAEEAKKDTRGGAAFRNRLAGGQQFGPSATPEALNRAMAGAISAQAKIEADEVTAASAIIKDLNLDKAQMRELATGGDAGGVSGKSRAIRAAAMKKVVDTQDIEGVNKLLDSTASMDAKTTESFADALETSKGKPHYVSNSAIADIRQGQGASSKDLVVKAIDNNTYSPDVMVTADKDELAHVAKVAWDPGTTANTAQLGENARTAQTDPILSAKIGKRDNAVDTLSRL